MQEKERPVLQAKRRISLISQKTTNETPQMREIRARMLQKQATLTKGLKSTKEDNLNKKLTASRKLENENTSDGKNLKGNKVQESTMTSPVKQKRRFSEIPKIIPKKPERRLSTINSNSNIKEEVSVKPTEESLTPQMRLMYEKLKERKDKKNVSTKKSVTSSSSSSNSTSSSSASESSTNYTSSSSSSSTSNSASTSKSKTPIKTVKPASNSPKKPQTNTVPIRKSRRSSLSQINTIPNRQVASNLPTLGEQVKPEIARPKEKVLKSKLNESLTSARNSRRTILISSKEPGN